jgi:hypothetical protein
MKSLDSGYVNHKDGVFEEARAFYTVMICVLENSKVNEFLASLLLKSTTSLVTTPVAM